MLLRRGGALGDTPMLLAARGEFSPGAMEIKPKKKTLYRHSTKLMGFHENLLWQVSTPRERSELLAAAPARRLDPDSVDVACNISDTIVSTAPHVTKESGSLKLAFITRISEKKNLHFLLELLREPAGKSSSISLARWRMVTLVTGKGAERCWLSFRLTSGWNITARSTIAPYHRCYTTTIFSSCLQGARISVMRQWNRL